MLPTQPWGFFYLLKMYSLNKWREISYKMLKASHKKYVKKYIYSSESKHLRIYSN